MSNHRYSRRAFGLLDTASPLLELYGTLVAVELALKDFAGSMSGNHDVAALAGAIPDPNVGAAATVLNSALGALICTGRNGLAVQVPPDNYPYVRYLRHASDCPGSTSDALLESARDAARTLRRELDRLFRTMSLPEVTS